MLRYPIFKYLERIVANYWPGSISILGQIYRRRVLRHTQVEKLRINENSASLENFEFKVFSQNGEDGIIKEIMRRLRIKNGFFVEFGIQDGTESCCRHLLEKEGWQGVWIDGDENSIHQAQLVFQKRPVKIISAMLTKENIVNTFELADIPKAFDLLVIDVDGNDYHLMKQLLRVYSPQVIVIEYNASVGPKSRWVMNYNPTHTWDKTCCHGASLSALTALAQSFNYRLVGCDSNGVNAFYVKSDNIDPSEWQLRKADRDFYNAPKFNPYWFGHPPFLLKQRKMLPVEPNNCSEIYYSLKSPMPSEVGLGDPFTLEIEIKNCTNYDFFSTPPNPIRLSYRWFSNENDEANDSLEGIRTELFPFLLSGKSVIYPIRLLAPNFSGQYFLEFYIVQEGVAWIQMSSSKRLQKHKIFVTAK